MQMQVAYRLQHSLYIVYSAERLPSVSLFLSLFCRRVRNMWRRDSFFPWYFHVIYVWVHFSCYWPL